MLKTLFYLTVPNFIVFFKILDREFNKDSKSVVEIFITSSEFYRQFCPKLSFQSVFPAVQTLTPLFYLTILNFRVFFHVIG